MITEENFNSLAEHVFALILLLGDKGILIDDAEFQRYRLQAMHILEQEQACRREEEVAKMSPSEKMIYDFLSDLKMTQRRNGTGV